MFTTYTAEVISSDGNIIGSRVIKIWLFSDAIDAYNKMLPKHDGTLINFRKV